MKWTSVLFTSLLFIGLSAKVASAQTITITTTDNKTAKQITANATITGLPGGWTAKGVILQARPLGGTPPKEVPGPGGYSIAKALEGGVWAGTMTNLTSKTSYNVQAMMIAIDNMAKTRFIFSAVVVVTVM